MRTTRMDFLFYWSFLCKETSTCSQCQTMMKLWIAWCSSLPFYHLTNSCVRSSKAFARRLYQPTEFKDLKFIVSTIFFWILIGIRFLKPDLNLIPYRWPTMLLVFLIYIPLYNWYEKNKPTQKELKASNNSWLGMSVFVITTLILAFGV